jgi:hypothetical protein
LARRPLSVEWKEECILKSLHPTMAEREAYQITVEKQILERLGEHSRIGKSVHLPPYYTKLIIF